MNLHALGGRPPSELAQALAEFESRFRYPLGPGRSFRISHGEDYVAFFRAMGNARSFIAEKKGRVIGALSVAIRTIVMPDGAERQAAYIGDLKVDSTFRGSFALLRLAQAADAWARPQVGAAYGVVMDGTGASPSQYTGRMGIPPFLAIGKIVVLRIPTTLETADHCRRVSTEEGAACHRALSRGRCFAEGGNPAERSQMEPFWLLQRDGLACGRLEDTRAAKILIADNGIEMQSAHLACFAWKTPMAGAQVIQSARGHAARLGLPALFIAAPEKEMRHLDGVLGPIDKIIAPATIYGAAFSAGAEWNINSSEI